MALKNVLVSLSGANNAKSCKIKITNRDEGIYRIEKIRNSFLAQCRACLELCDTEDDDG